MSWSTSVVARKEPPFETEQRRRFFPLSDARSNSSVRISLSVSEIWAREAIVDDK